MIGDNGAADGVGMPVDVFRDRMQHKIRAEIERILEIRRKKSIVDQQKRPRFMNDPGCFCNVDQGHQGIGRRFNPDKFRRSGKSGTEFIGIARVDIFQIIVPSRGRHGKQTVGSSVEFPVDENPVARVEQFKHGRFRRHSGGEYEAEPAVLQCGKTRFQRGPGRIADP